MSSEKSNGVENGKGDPVRKVSKARILVDMEGKAESAAQRIFRCLQEAERAGDSVTSANLRKDEAQLTAALSGHQIQFSDVVKRKLMGLVPREVKETPRGEKKVITKGWVRIVNELQLVSENQNPTREAIVEQIVERAVNSEKEIEASMREGDDKQFPEVSAQVAARLRTRERTQKLMDQGGNPMTVLSGTPYPEERYAE